VSNCHVVAGRSLIDLAASRLALRKALGITIPETLLATADEVIQ
jgi:hypothetical protein